PSSPQRNRWFRRLLLRVAAGAGASEDTVQHWLEPRCEQRITTFAEMQPIGRDPYTEPPVAVEQHIADFGVNDVLTIGAVANKAIYLRGCPTERSIGGIAPSAIDPAAEFWPLEGARG